MEQVFNQQICTYYFVNKNDLLDKNVEAFGNCECLPFAGGKCGDTSNCINSSMGVECPETCGTECENQKIRKGRFIKSLTLYDTGMIGLGVKTNVSIKEGSYILEYTGEVVSFDEFKLRSNTPEYRKSQHMYGLQINRKFVIDAFKVGNLGKTTGIDLIDRLERARFVNSSCEPNCYIDKIYVDGIPRMVLKASTDIDAGQTLTFNYKFRKFDESKSWECKCGAPTCTSKRKANLLEHREFTDDKRCDVCHLQFGYVSDRKRHTLIHNPEKLEVCVVCQKKFKLPADLLQHKRISHKINWKHNDDQLGHLICKSCKFVARYPSDLKKHMESHENERPYFCAKCIKCFKTKRNLKEHLKNLH